MNNNNLEIVDKSTISRLIKELKFIDRLILEKTSQLLPELKSTIKSLSEVVPKLDLAVEYISVVKNQDDELQTQIQNLSKVVDSLFAPLHLMDNQNRNIIIANEALVERIEEIDFQVIENVIRKDIKVLEHELKGEFIRLISKEFKQQKIKMMYIYLLCTGIFIIGSVTGAALTYFLKS